MTQLLFDFAIGDLPWKDYIWVFLLSSLKYLVGVLGAVIQGFNLAEVLLTAYLGAMLGVVALTYFGSQITEWLSHRIKRKKPMKYSRRKWIIKVWRKYGVWGIAFLAVVISPPASVAIALSFRTPPRKIILSLAVMLALWSAFFTSFRGLAKQIYDLF